MNANSPTLPVAWDGMRGWLNLPAAHTPQREALVFLAAHGSEDLCSRHSLACLAQQLCLAGHPVLRVDLPGTADALGDLLAPDLWAQWVAGAASAARHLQGWSGATHIGLLGLRLGALVATEAAKQLQSTQLPVSSLVLLAPVLQGRQHLRELRALADGGDTLTVAGITWGGALQADLSALDASKDATPPAVQRVFWAVANANKASLAVQQQWSATLPLHSEPYGDLVAHIGHTTHSQAPLALWQALGTWLAQGPAVGPLAKPAPTNAPLNTTLRAPHGQEHGWAMPSVVPLAGVLTLPQQLAPQTPVVVFCNTGRNPHMGWARSWVNLARQLAGDGVASLRFDIAGVGDSPPLPNAPAELLYNDVSLPQLADVVTHLLARLGTRPVVLVGNCSGGYLAFHHAKSDARITHLVLANVQKFVWVPGTSLEVALRAVTKSTGTYTRLVWQPDTWKRLVAGQIHLRPILAKFGQVGWRALGRGVNALRPSAIASKNSHATANPRQAVVQGFEAMARRGTQVSVLYSDDDGGRDEFASYFGADGKRFSRLPGAKLQVVTKADHVFSSPHAQAVLLQELLRLCAA